jgi:DedD protein
LDEQLKQRLVGAAVIVSLIVIFVPMLLDEPDDTGSVEVDTRIPDKPPELQQPLPSREILPKPVPVVPMTSVAELEQTPATEPEIAEQEPAAPPPIEPVPANSVTKPPVEEDVAETVRPTPGAWLVQVASFSQQENASRLVEQLKESNMPAQLQQVVVGGKRLYRVQMLPQLDRKDAEKLIERIKKEFKLKATLRRYSD